MENIIDLSKLDQSVSNYDREDFLSNNEFPDLLPSGLTNKDNFQAKDKVVEHSSVKNLVKLDLPPVFSDEETIEYKKTEEGTESNQNRRCVKEEITNKFTPIEPNQIKDSIILNKSKLHKNKKSMYQCKCKIF